MVNIVVLEGKVVSIDLDKKELLLSVIRSYRDNEGNYYSDSIKCRFWVGINNNIESYLNIEDTLLIKGRLELIDSEYIVMVDSFSLLHRSNKKISAK